MPALAPGNAVGRELAQLYPELERFRARREDSVQLYRKLHAVDYGEARPSDSDLARFRRDITKERTLLGDIDALVIHARNFSRVHRSPSLTEFGRDLRAFDNETNMLFALLRDEEKKIIRAQKHKSQLFGRILDSIIPDNKWFALGAGGALAGTITGIPVQLEDKPFAAQVRLEWVASALAHNPTLSHFLYDTYVVGFAVAGFSSVVIASRFVSNKIHGFVTKRAAKVRFLHGESAYNPAQQAAAEKPL